MMGSLQKYMAGFRISDLKAALFRQEHWLAENGSDPLAVIYRKQVRELRFEIKERTRAQRRGRQIFKKS
jgi:hypothetical protein